MKLLKPSLISGEIMTLIEEADEVLVLVSPYCDFLNWKKFINKMNIATSKNIPIEFYCRKGIAKAREQVKALNINPIEIENLHTKLYFNENEAIVTSMNLIQYSDINSLDIGYKTQTKAEYEEVIGYYNRYLKSKSIKKEESIEFPDWIEFIENKLFNLTGSNFRVFGEDEYLVLQGPNLYKCEIYTYKKQLKFKITGILSQKEFLTLNENLKKFEKIFNLDLKLKNPKDEYATVSHICNTSFETLDFWDISINKIENLEPIIFRFIKEVEDFKILCR